MNQDDVIRRITAVNAVVGIVLLIFALGWFVWTAWGRITAGN